ncbi:MAG TPA: hypothetical protein VJ997_08300 [Longimicrobiales bacterium]|nr:hypothetical protein [Longimicrobiales bacterium]
MPAAAAQNLLRARRRRARARAATAQGLFLSLMLSLPLGWSFVQSSFFAPDPTAAAECPDLSLLLAPHLQRNVRALSASGQLSTAQRNALSVKVCDASLQAVLRPLLGGVTDGEDLRSIAEANPALGGDLEAVPVLMSLLGGSGPGGDQ